MGIETHLRTPLAEAVRKAGSQSEFGRIIERKQSTVFDWLRLNKPLPAELVLTVERETGVSKHLLRPDIYPAEPSSVSLPADDHSGFVGSGGPTVACDRATLLHRSAAR